MIGLSELVIGIVGIRSRVLAASIIRFHFPKEILQVSPERYSALAFMALLTGASAILLGGCGTGESGAGEEEWSGSVEAEVDDLTGERTGVFRTYGPTRLLIAGQDSIPVTAGYWCEVDENTEPPAATDGLFFRISMPDTTLLSNDQAAFEELSGQLGLLDVARLAVDARVYAWQYDPTRTLGGWFLDGAMGFEPNDEFDTAEERDELLAAIGRLYNQLPGLGMAEYRTRAHGRILDIVQDAREQWPPAHDYVSSHYIGRDTVGRRFGFGALLPNRITNGTTREGSSSLQWTA